MICNDRVMGIKPKVTVIIAVYKDNERLNKCIEALDVQTYSKELMNVIIVNNDPEGDVKITIDHSLNLSILNEVRPGSYAARNLGIKSADAEVLAFADSDCIPSKTWITEAITSLKPYIQDKVILAGKVELIFQDMDKLTFAECYEKGFAFPHQRGDNKFLDGMVAGNVFIMAKTFKEIGLFNCNLLSGGDSEFSKRARDHNYLILYNPNCIVYHPAKYKLKEILQKRRRIFGGKVYRSAYVQKEGLVYSLFKTLYKQTIRYIKELVQVFRMSEIGGFYCRCKVITVIFLILISINIEFLSFAITRKMKRR